MQLYMICHCCHSPMLQVGDADDGLIGKVPCASSGITASLYMRRSAKKKSQADQSAGERTHMLIIVSCPGAREGTIESSQCTTKSPLVYSSAANVELNYFCIIRAIS